MPGSAPAELVLVGGGHAHVQVIRRFMMDPLPDVRLTVVLDRPVAVYSGMVPGVVAGDYAAPELQIDVVPLARRARARVLIAAAQDVDPQARRIALADRPSIPYDVASLDVGATVRGLDLPGVREHALATRPIADFVAQLDARIAALRAASPRVVVVGAGAAGVELALTLEARLRAAGLAPRVALLDGAPHVLRGYPVRVVRCLERELVRRGVQWRGVARVRGVGADHVQLEGESELPADLVIWATGAAPLPFPAQTALPRDAAGFVRVRPTLEVVDCDDLFAAGDCAALDWAPWVRKAGVYAVREGPLLDANLRARLTGHPLRRYAPQRDFLTLLNLGGGRAFGAKWGLAASGRGVWRLKDCIDRRFVRRFQVLTPDAKLAPGFPSAEAMGMEEMPCGGCAAKLGSDPLGRALARLPAPLADPSVRLGLETPDDAAAIVSPRGDVLLATIDGFRAFTDDPWLVGRVAAVNAVSDVLAKGGVPRHALAIVTLPEAEGDAAEETLQQVLAGVRRALDPLAVSLVGGHTTRGEALFVGLAVTGDAPDGRIVRLAGACPGDALILSRPLGTGVLLAADMRGAAPGPWVQRAHAQMLEGNAAAARLLARSDVHACTDVSGFGLAGHLAEMCHASGVAARIALRRLPALEGALCLLGRGLRSSFHAQNASTRRQLAMSAAADPAALALLFDPQTSGGLLLSVDAAATDDWLAALRAAGCGAAARIGDVTAPREDGAMIAVAP